MMNMNRSGIRTLGLILVVVILVLRTEVCWSLTKAEARQKIELASEKYNSEEYDSALELYKEIFDAGYSSAALWHNLGLAYFKNGQLSDAIVALEKARRLMPNNKVINHDLRLVNENVNSEIVSAPPFFLVRWYSSIVSSFGSRVWLVLHVLFLGGFLIGLYLYLIEQKMFGLHRTYIEGILVGIAIVSILFAIFSYSRSQMISRSDVGVISSDNIVLRLGAEDNTEVIMELNEGVKVYIEDSIGTFLKVRLEDYTIGWVKEEVVKVI